MRLNCPDCDRQVHTLLASTLPPFAARRLCSICGHPLGSKLTLPQFESIGGRFDIRDEHRLLSLHYGDDEGVIAA